MIFKRILLSLAACLLAISGVANAQDDDHGLINVRTTTVKTGHGAEYRELMGKLAASRKAVGHSGTDVWQVLRGPASTYYTVRSVDDYATFDGSFDSGMNDADWQRWLSRMSDVIVSAEVTTLRTHRELTIPSGSDSAPDLVMLRFTTLHSGNGRDHHDWLENELVPALTDGGRDGWNVSDVRLGDVMNTWISASRMDSWADLDGSGPLDHLSDADRRALFDSYNERVQSSRTEVIRHLPDASY